MGLFDKLKNIFIEEEVEDVPVEKDVKEDQIKIDNLKEEPKKKEPEVKEKKQTFVSEDTFSDRDLLDTNQKFKFPIIFEDDDFKEEKKKNKSINVLERVNNKYEPEIKKEVKKEKKAFKPSPVISPVYGILDKNYHKDEVNVRDGLVTDIEAKIDIDYVIKKAYGEEPIEEPKEEENKEEKITTREEKHKKQKSKDKDKVDLFDGIEKEDAEEVTAEEIDEKIKSIDDLLKDTTDEDFYSLVDSMYQDEEEGESK